MSKYGPRTLPRASLEGWGVSRAWSEEIPDLPSFLYEQLGQCSEASMNGQRLSWSVQQNRYSVRVAEHQEAGAYGEPSVQLETCSGQRTAQEPGRSLKAGSTSLPGI